MFNNLRKAIAGAAFVLFSGSAFAVPMTVDWSANGGADHFNDYTVTFAGFSADTLTSVADNSGTSGYYHDHGIVTNVQLDVLLDSVWTTIFSDTTLGNNASNYVTTLSNISFDYGVVSGLRWLAAPNVNANFHFMAGTQYHFDTTNPVPAPATLALIALGLMGLRLRKARA